MLESCDDAVSGLSEALDQLRRIRAERIDVHIEQGLPFWKIMSLLCAEFAQITPPGPVAVKLSKTRSDPWQDLLRRKMQRGLIAQPIRFLLEQAPPTNELFAGVCVETGRRPLTLVEVSRLSALLRPSGRLLVVKQFNQLHVPRPQGGACIRIPVEGSLAGGARSPGLRRVRQWEAPPLSADNVSAYYQHALQLLGCSNQAVYLRMESILWMLTPHAQFPETNISQLYDAQLRATSTLRSMEVLCPTRPPGGAPHFWQEAPSELLTRPVIALLCEAVNRSVFANRFPEKAAGDVFEMFDAWWRQQRRASPSNARVHNRGVLCLPTRALCCSRILERIQGMPGIQIVVWPRSSRGLFHESLEEWSRESEVAARCRVFLHCLRASSAPGARRLYAEDILRTPCVEFLEEMRVLLIDHDSLCEAWELLAEKRPTDVFCPWPLLHLPGAWSSVVFHFPYRSNTAEGKLLTPQGPCVY